MHNSVIFKWNEEDFFYLLKTCEHDEITEYVDKYFSKTWKIIEAGCGLGRYVRFYSDKGYDIVGIEYNPDTVAAAKSLDRNINVIEGDVLKMPYGNESINGIISLGVIEHFPDGCEKPLIEMMRVLKPGGVAIITVPSFNLVRRIKGTLFFEEINFYLNPIRILKRSSFVRKLLKKGQRPLLPHNRKKSQFNIYPGYGEFFEYRFTKSQIEYILSSKGFEIIESVPIDQVDGLYHEFGKLFVSFKKWQFKMNPVGRLLNNLLSRIPFCHNHMHLIVVRKPLDVSHSRK